MGNRKILLLSFDDGTIYDKRFVELLNRYGIPATFNLNSGLEDFVWHFEDKFPIRRQILADTVQQYRRHEVASHTLHHHWLNTLTPPQLSREVGDDCAALKQLFGLKEIGFNEQQIYTTLELKMKCGIGKCGRCNVGSKYVCKDGPVFRMDELSELPDEY